LAIALGFACSRPFFLSPSPPPARGDDVGVAGLAERGR